MNNLSGVIPNIPALLQSVPPPHDIGLTTANSQHYAQPVAVQPPTAASPVQAQPVYNHTQPYAFAQSSLKNALLTRETSAKPAPATTGGSELRFAALKQATYGFDERGIISEDRFGVVYRGKIDSRQVAVKRMKKVNAAKRDEFFYSLEQQNLFSVSFLRS